MSRTCSRGEAPGPLTQHRRNEPESQESGTVVATQTACIFTSGLNLRRPIGRAHRANPSTRLKTIRTRATTSRTLRRRNRSPPRSGTLAHQANHAALTSRCAMTQADRAPNVRSWRLIRSAIVVSASFSGKSDDAATSIAIRRGPVRYAICVMMCHDRESAASHHDHTASTRPCRSTCFGIICGVCAA